MADILAKGAANSTVNRNRKFQPLPISYIKRKFQNEAKAKWQTSWEEDEKGRYTYNFVKTTKEDYLLKHRNLYIFATNHGPFPAYLNTINKCPTNSCACGELGTSMHYLTDCILTQKFHIKKPPTISEEQWFDLIINTPHLKDIIIKLIDTIENDEIAYQGT